MPQGDFGVKGQKCTDPPKLSMLKQCHLFRSKPSQPLWNTERLFLVFSRTDLTREYIDKAVVIAKGGILWDKFVELADTQGMTVLIYENIRKMEDYIAIPLFVKEQLEEKYFLAIAYTAMHYAQCKELISLLAKHDIAAVPLKGTFLSRRIYADTVKRGFTTDIDLFVRWYDRDKIHRLLGAQGYVFDGTAETEQWLWQEGYANPAFPYGVDLIYDIWLRGRYPKALEGLWKGVRMATMEEGAVYYEFNEEELLIYMAVHLVTSDNGYRCLRYICDIGEFLKYHSVDFENIVDKVKKWGVSSALYIALVSTQRLSPGLVPRPVMERLRPGPVKRFAADVFFNPQELFTKNAPRRLMDYLLKDIFFELMEARLVKEYGIVLARIFMPPGQDRDKRAFIRRIAWGPLKVFNKLLCGKP